MRWILTTISLLAMTTVAHTQQPQPNQSVLSDDTKKSQQNAADEAAVRGRLEDGVKPGPPEDQAKANEKVEDAAVEAKRKSDVKRENK